MECRFAVMLLEPGQSRPGWTGVRVQPPSWRVVRGVGDMKGLVGSAVAGMSRFGF